VAGVPNRLIGRIVTVLVEERDRVLRVIEPVTGEVSTPNTGWSLGVKPASTTPTTAAHAPKPHGEEHA
jgi:hypothetical protein